MMKLLFTPAGLALLLVFLVLLKEGELFPVLRDTAEVGTVFVKAGNEVSSEIGEAIRGVNQQLEDMCHELALNLEQSYQNDTHPAQVLIRKTTHAVFLLACKKSLKVKPPKLNLNLNR